MTKVAIATLRAAGYGVVSRLAVVFRRSGDEAEIIIPTRARMPPREFLRAFGLENDPEAVSELQRLGIGIYEVPGILLARGRVKVVVTKSDEFGCHVAIKVGNRRVTETVVSSTEDLIGRMVLLYAKEKSKALADALSDSERRLAETAREVAKTLGLAILDAKRDEVRLDSINGCRVRVRIAGGKTGAGPDDVLVEIADGVHLPLSRVPPGMLARNKVKLVLPQGTEVTTTLGPVVMALGKPGAIIVTPNGAGLIYGDILVEESCRQEPQSSGLLVSLL